MTDRHPAILDATEAARYLRLDAATDSPEAAQRLLYRLIGKGHVHPIKWGKAYLFARPDLDAFVAAEIEALDSASEYVSEGSRG